MGLFLLGVTKNMHRVCDVYKGLRQKTVTGEGFADNTLKTLNKFCSLVFRQGKKKAYGKAI